LHRPFALAIGAGLGRGAGQRHADFFARRGVAVYIDRAIALKHGMFDEQRIHERRFRPRSGGRANTQ
jgi:hypothetical protein